MEVAVDTEHGATPPGPSNKLLAAFVGLAALSVPLYLVVCIACQLLLAHKLPIDVTEYAQSSWLTPPPEFGAIPNLIVYGGYMFGGMIFLLGRWSLGLTIAFLAVCGALATSQTNALRFGVLQGDARIGCYSYESLECKTMLGAPTDGARSIFAEGHENDDGDAHYAGWYQGMRRDFKSQVRSSFPSSMPGIAFLSSPWALVHIDEIRDRLQTQRETLNQFKANTAQ